MCKPATERVITVISPKQRLRIRTNTSIPTGREYIRNDWHCQQSASGNAEVVRRSLLLVTALAYLSVQSTPVELLSTLQMWAAVQWNRLLKR